MEVVGLDAEQPDTLPGTWAEASAAHSLILAEETSLILSWFPLKGMHGNCLLKL